MAALKKEEGSRKRCGVCGKPLYRPLLCSKCGEYFCREHISPRRHKCGASERTKVGLPSRRRLLVASLCLVGALSLFATYTWMTHEEEGMMVTGKRSLTVGPYLQYSPVGLRRSGRLAGMVVRDLARIGGEIWAATDDGLFRLRGSSWKAEEGLPSEDVYSLAEGQDGSPMAACAGGAYIRREGKWSLIGEGPEMRVTALAVDDQGTVWIGGDGGIGFLHGGTWNWLEGLSSVKVRALSSSRGSVIASSNQGLLRLSEEGWSNISQISGSRLPSVDVRGLATDGAGDLWVCTARGVVVFDGKDYGYSFTGANGLPYEDTTCVDIGPNGTVWVGTSRGLCELRSGRWHYYEGPRWLEDDDLRSVLVGPGWVLLGSSDGVSKMVSEWMTLEEKARRINSIVQQRHVRDGYVDFINLKGPGDLSDWTYDASDNDGLWTSVYLAAESFRYAVTKDPKAKANARECYEALKRLERLTGIRGVPARAAVRVGDEKVVKSGGEWHKSSVDPEWEWKGDTSSDEIDGHYFAYAIYFDLVADDAERRDVAALVSRITDHIIDHDFYLVDLDGEPTMWGVWNPEKINDDPRWFEEHGLNSLEILSHLKVAIHMTGKEKYREAYRRLIEEYHYHLNTIGQKILPPGSVNHSDDELAFLAYYPLMLYEDDPSLRTIYLQSIERSWQIERPERSPFFNFVYGAATGADFDLEESVEELRGMSPDLLDWPVANSHRSDVQARLDKGEVFTLPFENRNMRRWNANPYRLDWGGGGTNEGDGAYFLMPYWMGRYHGFIEEG